jgi:hypothetical protein
MNTHRLDVKDLRHDLTVIDMNAMKYTKPEMLEYFANQIEIFKNLGLFADVIDTKNVKPSTYSLSIHDLRRDLSVSEVRALGYNKVDIAWYFRHKIEFFKTKLGCAQ